MVAAAHMTFALLDRSFNRLSFLVLSARNFWEVIAAGLLIEPLHTPVERTLLDEWF